MRKNRNITRLKLLLIILITSLISVTINSSTAVIRSTSDFYNYLAPSDSSHNSEILKKLKAGEKPNHLIHEKSPYLLIHAFNPVNWYPWGNEAFELARKQNKPIFLSVGYYTCYWCHVMEREIFENDSLAALMNKYFICIKVDREERPDVDRVYMNALQAMTGSGGWPMTMFLTPDLKPFYGTTYIPPKSSYGRPGFSQVVNAVHDQWEHNRDKLNEIAGKVNDYLKKTAQVTNDQSKLSYSILKNGFDFFNNQYDKKYGGFGTSPKFPQPTILDFLLNYSHTFNDKHALTMAVNTLTQIANGGINDHLSGGFHRYSTDKKWLVPHFEKMLYDQALLTSSYLSAYQVTKNKNFLETAEQTLNFVGNEMTSKAGGFFTAMDAESTVEFASYSKKQEGAFYLWTKEQIDSILPGLNSKIFDYYFDVQSGGNTGREEFGNKNILHIAHSIKETSDKFGLTQEQAKKTIIASAKILLKVRTERPKPNTDDKILTSWNGLMISSFARAYQVTQNQTYLKFAENAAGFILNKLYSSKDKILYHRYRDNQARFPGGLEDYSFFIKSLIDLYEASLNFKWLKYAVELTDQQIKLFYDSINGGFYDITNTDPSILVRTKEWYDGAEPSGNSITMLNLLRLSQITGKKEFHEIAVRSLKYFSGMIKTAPQAATQFLVDLNFYFSSPKEIIIAGKQNNVHTGEILKEINSHFIPNKVIMLADQGEGQKYISSFLPFINSVKMINNEPTAYVCENYACRLPTSDIKKINELLTEKK